METFRIDIIHPKAKKLLRDLADLNLIRIQQEKNKPDIDQILIRLRKKTAEAPSLEEVTTEVEAVRKARYGK